MSKNEEKPVLYAVIRLRGQVNVHHDLRATLDMLNIRKNMYMTLVPSTPSYLGMLKKVRDLITWGEIEQEILEHVLNKRGELEGREKITDKYIKDNTEYATIKAFSKALVKGETSLNDVPNMKRFFRLRPARKGYKGVKRGFAEGGEVGYRGSAINELIVRMA